MLSKIAETKHSRTRFLRAYLRLSAFLLLSTIMLKGCGDSPSEPDAPDQGSLLLSRLIVSMVPGGSETVTIQSRNGAGKLEPCTITNSDPTVASVTLSDSTLRIIGLVCGTTDITITHSSGQVRLLPVRVYAADVLETEDLFITYVDHFSLRWNDLGSGGSRDGSFYHPVTRDGYHALGSLGQGPSGYPNPNGAHAVMVVKARPGRENALAHPTDYELIYYDVGSGADMFGSFWRPIPPTGYVAMGTVVSPNSWDKPSLSDVVCVRSDLTVLAETGAFLYDDLGTGARHFLSCWESRQPDAGPHEFAYLEPGTFVAVNNWSCPTANPMLHVLKVDLPTLAETPFQDYGPKLTGYASPASETVPTLAKAMLLPCSIITDPLHVDIGWKIVNSPMYRLERCVFYRLLYHNYNQTSEKQTNSVAMTSGITTTEANRIWNETAISLSVEAGVSIKVFESKVTATVSRAMGYETETSISELRQKTISTSINVPPGKAAALWQQYTRYVLYRHAGTALEPVSAWELGVDSYITDEYPD